MTSFCNDKKHLFESFWDLVSQLVQIQWGKRKPKPFLHQYLQKLFSVLQTPHVTTLITVDDSHSVIFQKYKSYNYNWNVKTSKIDRKKKKMNWRQFYWAKLQFGISMLSKLAVLKPRNFVADGIPKLSFQMLRFIFILFTRVLNLGQTLLTRLNQIRHKNFKRNTCDIYRVTTFEWIHLE